MADFAHNRNGIEQGIPLDMLSVEEIERNIDELRCMAVGCQKHAEELARYRDKTVALKTAKGVNRLAGHRLAQRKGGAQ